MTGLSALLSPFSTKELAEESGLGGKEIGRYRHGNRSPANGPKVRAIAQALVALRAREGLPVTDFAATIEEVAAAVRVDVDARKARRLPR